MPSLLGWSRAHAFGICLRFRLLASFSAFGFVLGFWLRSRLCLRYQLLHLFSTRAFVVRRVPSLLLPAARVSAFRLVSLLSACAFDLGLCFCTRLVPSLLRPGILLAFDFDF